MVSDTMVMSTPYCATPPPTPPTHRKSGLLRGEWMRAKGWCGHRRVIEERDDFAPFQLIQVRSVPASQGPIAGYRIRKEQSGCNKTILQSVTRCASSVECEGL